MGKGKIALLAIVLSSLLALTGCVGGVYWPPDVILTASPTMGAAPLAVTFTISAEAHYGAIASFVLDFGDGTTPASGTDLTAPIHHNYTAEGTFTAKVRVQDDRGLIGRDSVVIIIIPPDGGLNPPPIPSFTFTPPEPTVGQPVTFNASGSTDPGSAVLPLHIVEYLWNFGDGGLASGILVTHTYGSRGEFTVTLTVIDDDGAARSLSRTVVVHNTPPVARLTCSPTNGIPPLTVNCDAMHSHDPDGTIVRYQWDFDAADGLDWEHPDAEGVTASHVYTSIGNYTITLRVVDDAGAEGFATIGISVSTAPPVAKIRAFPEGGYAPLEVTFDGTESYDPDGGPIVRYEWDFDASDGLWWETGATEPPPGEGAVGSIVTHTFTEAGIYKVTLRVKDDEGEYGQTGVEIKVEAHPIEFP